jgi:hypothetical protein
LVAALLDLGRCREAQEELMLMPPETQHSQAGLKLTVRTALQLGETEEATRLSAQLETEHPGLESQLFLAQAALETNDLEAAEARLNAINAAAHIPLAHFMLGSIYSRREQDTETRQELLAALDTTRDVEVGNVTGWHLLPQICAALATLTEPLPNCRAWSARVDLSAIPGPEPRPQALNVTVTALAEEEGRRQLGELYAALYPGGTLMQSQVTWELLPADRQPTEPVCPAIWFEGLE